MDRTSVLRTRSGVKATHFIVLAVTVLATVVVVVVGGEPGEWWDHLLPIVGRTALLGLGSGFLAASAAAVLAYSFRTSSGLFKLICGLGACLPIAVPPVVIATTLIQSPFAMDPYRPAVLIVSQALANLPIAFVIQAAVLSLVSDSLVLASASLGMSPRKAARRIFGKRLAWSYAVSGLVASLFAVSDPSVTLVYGGTESYLASHIYRGGNAGMATGEAMTAILALLLPAIFLAVYLTRFTMMRWSTESWSSPSVTAAVSKFFTPQYVSKSLAMFLLLGVFLVLSTIVFGTFGTSVSEVMTMGTVTSTIVTVVLVALVALVGGLFTVWLSWKGTLPAYGVSFLLIFSLLVSQTAIGMMLSTLHRNAVTVGGTTVLPSLVGGGALAGGYVAVAIAYLAIAIPIAHVGLNALLRSRVNLYDTARDNGAGSVRALVTVLSNATTSLVALIALLAGIILTRTAPIVFVQPPGYSIASTDLITLAAAGWDQQVFALGMVTATIPAAAFFAAAFLELRNRRRSE